MVAALLGASALFSVGPALLSNALPGPTEEGSADEARQATALGRRGWLLLPVQALTWLALVPGLVFAGGLGVIVLLGGVAIGIAVVSTPVAYIIDALFGTGHATYYLVGGVVGGGVLVFGGSFLLSEVLPGRWGKRFAGPSELALDVSIEAPDWLTSHLVAPVSDRFHERLTCLRRLFLPRPPLRKWSREEFERATVVAYASDADQHAGRVALVFRQSRELIHRRDWRRAAKHGEIARFGVYHLDWITQERGPHAGDSWRDTYTRRIAFEGFGLEVEARAAAKRAIAGCDDVPLTSVPLPLVRAYTDQLRRGVHLSDSWSADLDARRH